MNRQILGALCAASLIVAGTTFAAAQDGGSVDWSGFYLGIAGGYAPGHIGIVTDSAVTPFDGMVIDFNTTGGLLGATAGASMQTGNLVFGIEGDLSRAGIVGEADPINLGGDDAILTATIDWLGTLRGRIGVSAGNALFFATGGLAAGGVRGVVTNFPTDGNTSSAAGTQYGYVVGAGVEVAVTDALSIKGEYLYVDLGTAAYELPPLTANTHPTASVVRVGFNYGF